MLDLSPLLNAIIPALVGIITAQRLPDEVVPVKAKPETPHEKLTVIGATIVILSVVEAIRSGQHDQIDPVQFASALAVIWAVLPRAHQMVDLVASPFKKKAE